MLNLIYTKAKARSKVCADCRDFFSLHKKLEWFQDKNVQIIMEDIDDVVRVEGWVLLKRDGTAIPPEYLSTGTKTILCVLFHPEMIFNATQMGDNVLGFLHQICKHYDRTVLVYHYIAEKYLEGIELQKDYEPFKLEDYDDNFDEWIEEGMDDV